MRLYSSIAVPTTLASPIGNSDTTIAVAATVGYPTAGAGNTFTAALDAGAATEELVDVTAVSGNVWTVVRGVDGTGAQAHSAGAVVRHSSGGRDFADMQAHIAATTNVHGVTGALVGTSTTQTLSNKTLTAPTINAGALTGTFTGSPTLSGAVSFTGHPILQGATSADVAAGVRVAADTQDRLALRADGALLLGSGSAAADVTLARSGAGAASLTASLAVSGAIAGASTVGTVRTNATDVAFQEQLTGDANQRWTVGGDGKISWGPGVTPVDTALYRTGVGALRTDGSFTTGGDLVVGGIGQRLFAIKTSDTSRANTAATAFDPHLQVTLAANATYVMRGLIIWGNSEAGDILFDFDVPSGASGTWTTAQPATSTNTDPTTVRVVANGVDVGRSYGWTNAGGGLPNGASLNGVVKTSSGGTYTFQWAQFVSDSTPTIVYQNSYILMERVA